MLIAFAVTNHACFRDRQELSAEAPQRSDDSRSFATGVPRSPRLNRVTAIYGPNGSGKSRLAQAFRVAQKLVVHSAKESQAGEAIPYTPFLFDDTSDKQPTTFEISFIQEQVVYEYIFSIDRKRVHEESLLAWYPEGRMRRLLHRASDPETDREDISFGSSVRGSKELWRKSTRSNALLVSVATQLNSETFRPVVDWFQTLAIMGPGGLPPTFTAESIRKDENVRKRVVRLLQDADISVTDVMTREKSLGVDSLREQLPPELIREITSSGKETVDLLSIQFAHHPTGVEKPLFLDLEDESDGTKRLFALAWPWLDVLDRNMVLVVDELDRSLHPLLVASLIRRINSEGDSGSAKRAQLVATVHDANLLQEVLGREQVWLTNKSRSTEATTITPLSDFRPRKSESLIRGYLGGRYGGTPIITETPLGD